MKIKILGALLVLSLLLNVAGLVFFICFINLSGHYKMLKRQRNEIAHSLNIISGANGAAFAEQIYRRNFISQVDGEADAFALIPPVPDKASTDLGLVVYLHGMGSNFMEPLLMPRDEPLANAVAASYPNLAFMSCSYRKESSWGNDKAMSDISQNIREVLNQYPIKRIVIMGTSMGGCTALTYAAQSPPDIKDKIVGVVSVESAGNLSDLYKESRHPALKPALIAALGGTPEQVPAQYNQKSFLYNLDAFPSSVRVAIVSARDDDIVPPNLQKDVAAALERRHVPVKLFEIDGGHGIPRAAVYLDGLQFAMLKG